MKRIIFNIVTALFFFTFSAHAFAENGPRYRIDLSYMSKYVWRGAVFQGDGVFQPSLSGDMGNLSVNLWGNAGMTDKNGATQMNEWDYTIEYSYAAGSIGYSAGVIGYTFPNSGGPGTTEIYVGASYETILNPSLTFYYDLEAVEGTYISLGTGYRIPVGKITNLDILGAIGFGDEKMNRALYGSGFSGAGLADVLFGVSASFGILENFSVTPSVSFSSILDRDGQNSYDAMNMSYTNAFFGLTLSAAY